MTAQAMRRRAGGGMNVTEDMKTSNPKERRQTDRKKPVAAGLQLRIQKFLIYP